MCKCFHTLQCSVDVEFTHFFVHSTAFSFPFADNLSVAACRLHEQFSSFSPANNEPLRYAALRHQNMQEIAPSLSANVGQLAQ